MNQTFAAEAPGARSATESQSKWPVKANRDGCRPTDHQPTTEVRLLRAYAVRT